MSSYGSASCDARVWLVLCIRIRKDFCGARVPLAFRPRTWDGTKCPSRAARARVCAATKTVKIRAARPAAAGGRRGLGANACGRSESLRRNRSCAPATSNRWQPGRGRLLHRPDATPRRIVATADAFLRRHASCRRHHLRPRPGAAATRAPTTGPAPARRPGPHFGPPGFAPAPPASRPLRASRDRGRSAAGLTFQSSRP
jgi:hypothetical protein